MCKEKETDKIKEDTSVDWLKEFKEQMQDINYACPHCNRCPVCGKRYNDYPCFPPPFYPTYRTDYIFTVSDSSAIGL